MFQEVLSEKAQDLIDKIAGQISSFYLAGGTGPALQLGHRVSEDFDFFSEESFDTEEIEAVTAPEKVISVRPRTIHCVKDGIRLSFLFYGVPLCYPMQIWRGLHVAAWQDIWERIKQFFEANIKEFEKALIK
jgi:hypothetical protein